MNFSDNFFNRVEKKTKVNKETILELAEKLQKSDMKDEQVLKDFVDDVSKVAGREVSEEKKDKIVKAILNDNVPKDVDKMF